MTNIRSASVVAYTQTGCSQNNGFVLPLLRADSVEKWLIQKAEEGSDKISSFQTLDDEVTAVAFLANPIAVQVEGMQIYVFVENTTVHAGSKFDIETPLREFINKNPNNLAVSLQICEMVGSLAEQKAARIKMRGAIQLELGHVSARYFYETSANNAFWSKLFSKPNFKKVFSDSGDLRSLLRVSIDDDGFVKVESSEFINSMQRDFVDEIQSQLNDEFSTGNVSEFIDYSFENVKTKHRLEEIYKVKRQEERIAIILRELLIDAEAGIRIFNSYVPRASFESMAMNYMKISLTQNDRKKKESLSNTVNKNDFYMVNVEIISSLMLSLFSHCFPANRGKFLLAFSKHLASFPGVNFAIEDKLNRTRSAYISDELRRSILYTLHIGMKN